jgi:hypothetical protein
MFTPRALLVADGDRTYAVDIACRMVAMRCISLAAAIVARLGMKEAAN